MLIDCVVKNTLISENTRKIFQQVGNVWIDGQRTNNLPNTDSGLLYANFTFANNIYSLNIFKDVTKAELVASATSATLPAVVDLITENSSGLTGRVFLIQYGGDDLAITIRTLLSVDSDLPLTNINLLTENDPIVGYALYHQLAFKYLTKEFILSRYASIIYNHSYQYLAEGTLDPANVKGAGYDLSKINNWEVFREASAHYALSRICEKHSVDPNGTFAVRSKDSRYKVAAYLKSIDVSFDTTSTGQETKRRTLSTWKVAR